jgi:hypothetical protein
MSLYGRSLYIVLFLCRVITAIGAEGVFLVPFTLSMEIVGGKQTMGLLPWVTFKTLLGTGLDHFNVLSGQIGSS